MAIHMGQYMAIYLAEIITGLLQRVLTHPERGLVNETNAALLTPKFWVQAIYTELLLASSRLRAVRRKEFFFLQCRASTGHCRSTSEECESKRVKQELLAGEFRRHE